MLDLKTQTVSRLLVYRISSSFHTGWAASSDSSRLSNKNLRPFRRSYLRATEDEGSKLLEEDMERYNKRASRSEGVQPGQYEEHSKAGAGVKDLLDKLLIGDFFFVLLALAWLALGVVEKSTLNSSQLLDVWFPLWTLVFQPAIGVLMLGALVSGGLGWLQKTSR